MNIQSGTVFCFVLFVSVCVCVFSSLLINVSQKKRSPPSSGLDSHSSCECELKETKAFRWFICRSPLQLTPSHEKGLRLKGSSNKVRVRVTIFFSNANLPVLIKFRANFHTKDIYYIANGRTEWIKQLQCLCFVV